MSIGAKIWREKQKKSVNIFFIFYFDSSSKKKKRKSKFQGCGMDMWTMEKNCVVNCYQLRKNKIKGESEKECSQKRV